MERQVFDEKKKVSQRENQRAKRKKDRSEGLLKSNPIDHNKAKAEHMPLHEFGLNRPIQEVPTQLRSCPHFDGEMCYFHINNADSKPYPQEAKIFKCPEHNRYGRSRCCLTQG